MKVNLIVPGLPQYKEDVLFLVILDNKYGERVPEQLGILVIDHLVVTMTVEALQQDGDTWKKLHICTVISKRNTVKSLDVPQYDLKGVQCRVHIMREDVIPPFVACGEGS